MGVLLACLCITCVFGACGGQKGALESLALEVPPTERWDLSPGSLQEHSVLLITELSLQSPVGLFCSENQLLAILRLG